jgi:site-specific DNA recombinase
VKVILYARVSTRGQAERGYSLRQQIEALRTHAKSNNMDVLAECTDDGYSGITLDRPGLDRVRELVEVGGVDLVLAQDRDRFAREPAFHYLLETEFGKYGTKLVAINDWGGDTPEGQLLRGIQDQVAKYERVLR